MLVPWTRQPPGTTFVGLDPQNPLAQGIVGGIDARGWSLVGKGVTRVGTHVNAVLPGGIAMLGNNARLLSEQFASGPIDYPFTMVFVMSNVTRTANADVAGGLGNTGGDQICAIQFQSTTNNRFIYRNVNTGTTLVREYSANATTSNTGPVVVSVTVNSASSADVYWNGVLDNGSTSGSTSNAPAMNRFAIGGVDRGTDAFADTGTNVLLGFVTSKGWKAQEHFNYAKNPWQIFRPIVVPAKAPAAGAYTLTADNAAWNFAAQDAALKVARKLSAANAPWEFAAQSAGLTVARKLAADNAAWEFAAQDATLTYAPAGAYTLTAESADWQFAVPDATLTYTPTGISSPSFGGGGGRGRVQRSREFNRFISSLFEEPRKKPLKQKLAQIAEDAKSEIKLQTAIVSLQAAFDSRQARENSELALEVETTLRKLQARLKALEEEEGFVVSNLLL